MKKNSLFLLFIALCFNSIPNKRVVAEWETSLGTMIRWPLGIPSELVIELAEENIIYVLVETNYQQGQATNSFNNWGINLDNVIFINTPTYSHWTRDHGPQFVIGENSWEVVNQQFDGYPEENGCDYDQQECDESMILVDCEGIEFCNNQPGYSDLGYDCYVNNNVCEDFNGDGLIMDWLGDGYCDDGNWGLNFMCDEYSWDCGDCGGDIIDENLYCDDRLSLVNSYRVEGRPLNINHRGWEEDDDTNIDFANQLGWSILDLPLYLTGGNFMTDGYGMGFSTKLMMNENNLEENNFLNIVQEYLNINNYHIFENPNEQSIQHIDCLAKLVGPETIIIKQVSELSPEYECIENFAEIFYDLNTFYDRPFNIYRILCPEINGGNWETNPVAAYTNSFILNNKVLVPQYGIIEDLYALDTYRQAMPGYEVLGFDDNWDNPWYGEDALHCRTMGVFDPEMIHISHKSIRSNELTNNNIYIEAEIIDYSNYNSVIESVITYWKYIQTDGPYNNFTLENTNGHIYVGSFPVLDSDSEIEYFITAINSQGKSVSNPNAGWHMFHTLEIITGDINEDGNINILDVILIVNIILEMNEYNHLADVNDDGNLDILDIVELVNIILDL